MALARLFLLTLILLMGACRPQSLPRDPLPADLRVSLQLDSIIVADPQDRFTQLAPGGQGPEGALIRYNYKSSIQNKSFTTLTYNEQNQVVGLFEYQEGYNQQIVRQAHYRGGYVATVWIAYLPSPPWAFSRSPAYLESLKKDVAALPPSQIVTYQYDAHQQVARILSYQRMLGTNRFKLYQLTENRYTYGSTVQRHQVRATSYPGPTTIVYHWQGGDIIQEDQVLAPTPISPGGTITTRYRYGNERNPFTRSQVLFNCIDQSQHNRISTMDQKGNVTSFAYTYQYDSLGRLVSQVVGDQKGTGYWSGYTFEYAR